MAMALGPDRLAYPQAWLVLHILLDDAISIASGRLVRLEGMPRKVRVEKTPGSDANTCEVEFAWEDFPFEPRIFRGATVEIYLSDAGRIDPSFFSGLARDRLVRENAIFVGIIDEAESRFSDQSRSTVLRGRDYTAYFLDLEAEQSEVTFKRGSKTLSLLEIVEELVALRESTQAIQVDDVDGAAERVFPAEYRARAIRQDGTGSRKTRDGESVWDIIQELALEAGLVAYVDLDRIVIRRPTTIFNERVSSERLRMWTLGYDVSEYRISRDLGRQHGFRVRVTSWDPETQTTLASTYPPALDDKKPDPAGGVVSQSVSTISQAVSSLGLLEATRDTIGATSLGGQPQVRKEKNAVVRPFVVRGVSSQEQLDEIAKQLYELLIHHEVEAEIRTFQLRDTNGKPVQDILWGDPVVVEAVPEFDGLLGSSAGEMVKRLLGAGYAADEAAQVAAALSRLRLPFYVHSAVYQFSADDGDGFELTVRARTRRQVDLEDLAKEAGRG